MLWNRGVLEEIQHWNHRNIMDNVHTPIAGIIFTYDKLLTVHIIPRNRSTYNNIWYINWHGVPRYVTPNRVIHVQLSRSTQQWSATSPSTKLNVTLHPIEADLLTNKLCYANDYKNRLPYCTMKINIFCIITHIAISILGPVRSPFLLRHVLPVPHSVIRGKCPPVLEGKERALS